VGFSSLQAGAHANVTENFAFAQNAPGGGVGAALRNAEVVFPIGFAGYPPVVKTCAPVQLQAEECPPGSQIGALEVVIRENPEDPDPYNTFRTGLYNMVPSPNLTAVFGFTVLHTIGGTIVVTVGPDYRVHARAVNVVTGGAELVRQSITVWGVPAASSHDALRGFSSVQFGHLGGFELVLTPGGIALSENPVPFLVNPTECTSEPVEAELANVESWEGDKAETVFASVGAFTGCESLKFVPTISVAPEQTQATSPTGYEVNLRVPQTEGAEGLATADLKEATVRMPVGVVLSPSAATGLESCSEAQIGLHTEQPVECPDASKLGTVSVITPALTGELKGSLYLGGPASGPITGPPFTVYLTLAGHGVLVKIRGTVTPDPATGQITTTFDENPELPFSELKLHLNGGSRSTVANPSACGSYSAEADLTPWSTPFTPDATPTSPPFTITGCEAPRFAPAFEASTASNQAGGYSPMNVTFSREDADEDLAGLTVTTPSGLSGNLTGVPLCGEPQAAEGTCSAASQIGEVTAGAGPGPEPVFIKGGRVFLTGPYDGAPFGLSIDVSEHAGPLDFGSGPCDCEVVRATVSVNPQTAQLTVTNSALPTGKDGIPFQVKKVNVDINRPNFVFNPTNCNPLSVTGTMSSTQGMRANVSNHFQVTNCANLKFKPKFTVSTSAKTSRVNGASLTVHVSYPKSGDPTSASGGQANIKSVHVELPKSLPSRLSTLQKACPAATFENNPADCSPGSIVGHALVHTQILPVPLTGPAYFVSHGGAQFPELVIVLQGYGVTVDLHGETFINEKTNITSSTFKETPDVPFETFELNLPEGPNSALAAIGNLCSQHLVLPTQLTAHNGAELNQQTPIEVEGCPNSLSVVSEKVKGNKVTLKVVVPAGGKLSASGKGLKGSSKSSSGRETITITVPKKKAGKLVTKIKLSFKPKKGKQLSKTVTAKFKH